MKIKMSLPPLTEVKNLYRRPVKYSLFLLLGLAVLAACCDPENEIDLQDKPVAQPSLEKEPQLMAIQVYMELYNKGRTIK